MIKDAQLAENAKMLVDGVEEGEKLRFASKLRREAEE